ncbi:3-dehydroquinate synthase [bacterium]|nr:3-dehydroquinate synthase [bacterium]
MADNTESLVKVNVAPAYDIHIGPGILTQCPAWMETSLGYKPTRAFLIADPAVSTHASALEASLQQAGIQVLTLWVEGGESSKIFSRLEQLLDAMLATRPDRRTPVIALGGGVIGDMAALCASLLLRGVPMIQCPTTLLAQVDSSVGGKTAVNSPHGKNLIGTFYQPSLVLADTHTLSSLPERQMLAGYAEIVKYGLLGDAEFFAWLERHGADVLARNPDALAYAITHACRMKADIVARDPHEKKERMLLNLGHTFGHALEKAFDYDGRLLHGEAVALGMHAAAHYSVRHHGLPETDAARITAHYRQTGLPLTCPHLPETINAAWLTEAMKGDKKADNQTITLIVLESIGKAAIVTQAPESAIRQCWQELGFA